MDAAPLADAALAAHETARRLEACLQGLDARAAGAIRAAFFGGQTYERLAQGAGLPLGSMKSLIRRGLMRLKACLELMSASETDPPDDDLDVLAGEFCLGLLDAEGLARVATLRQQEPRFEQAVRVWEQRLMPLAEALTPVPPPARVWAGIAARVAPAAPSRRRPVLWNNLQFWRYFGLGAGAFGAAALAVALLLPPRVAVPVATATLITQHAGLFVASAQNAATGTVLVVSPADVVVPPDKSAELWLVLPGRKPASLGLLASDHSVTINLAAHGFSGAIAGVELAVSLEPLGGSPTGVATGPIIATAKFSAI